jgi:NADH-quinone oxidoreductase subunit G
LWVVGANPLARHELAARDAFVVAQDLFLTETAQRANVVLPASSAYEKAGTVTNVCGDVQKLNRGARTMGTKPDLEIIGLLAKEMRSDWGVPKADAVFREIRRVVRGYDFPLPIIETGGAAASVPATGELQFQARPELTRGAQNTLFTSGTLGKFSKTLHSVLESPGALYRDPHRDTGLREGSVQLETASGEK